MKSANVTANTVAYPTDYNSLIADSSGASRLLASNQLGYFTLSTNPTNGKTITLTINGTAITITFVISIGSTAGNVLIGASAAATCANLIQLLYNPTITNSTQVAIGTNTSTNVTLINYVNYSLSGTTLTLSSMNTVLNQALTSFSASTNVTSDSWTAQTMQLYVQPGVVYVNGTEIYFAGGSTTTVTAPSSHPRIDVLTMDNTGTLNWTTGTESASPSAPTYPANQIPICELYNVVSETVLYDNANQTSGGGYIYNDVRPFLSTGVNLSAVPDSILPAANDTYNLGSASFQWNFVYTNNLLVNGLGLSGRFGGTGADGSLSITSGTTTINASNAGIVVKNYTSISITSTGTLAFSNPATTGTVLILKSQGAVTLTSSSTPMINASAMGAAGGAAVTSTSNSNGNPGTNGTAALMQTNLATAATTTPSVGTGGAVPTTIIVPTSYVTALLKYPFAFVGAGGSSGAILNGGSSVTTGAGGNGGGCLIMECAGLFNFTTANGISVAGQNGGTAIENNPSVGGGGGGGGGGCCIILYNSLTANSGTVTYSGGTGGNTGTGTSGQTRYGGAGGGSLTAGNNGTSSSSASTKTGGNGGTGQALVAANTEYA